MDERTQALLESKDPRERSSGLRLVVLYEDQDAAPHAGRLLDDPEPEVREHAARALGITRGGAALERLASAAHADDDAIVRRTALAILGETGERAAAKKLSHLLATGPHADRPTAVEALRACADPGEGAALAPLAADPDPRLRVLALHAAVALGAATAPFADTARAVLAEGPLWAVPAAALAQGSDPARELVSRQARAPARDLERASLRALELPSPAREAVLRALATLARPDAKLAAFAAARELARHGANDAAPLLAHTLYGPDASAHVDAACSLAELSVCSGEPLLLHTVERASPGELARVGRALALLGRPEGVRALGALLSGEVPHDRRHAALAFAALGRRDGVLELVRALDYPYRRERVEALEALRHLWREGPEISPLASAAERAPLVARWAEHFTAR